MRTQTEKALDLVEAFGGSQSETFAPDGIPITDLAERHGTPLYLYSGTMIAARISEVREALGTDIAFSIKANPSLGLCQLIAGEGIGAEVASAGELAVALAAGFDAADIIFAGPGKTDDELRALVEAGIYACNVESVGEIARLAAVVRDAGTTIGVGLRINPPTQLIGSQMRMGGAPSPFGIDYADLSVAVDRVLAHPELTLRGIHVYTATQIFEAEPLLEHCRKTLDLALETADLAGRPLEMVDLGGGFGVPYFEKNTDFDLEGFGTGIREMLATYGSDERLAGCRFMFELGRYLVGHAGIYVMRVVDVKSAQGKTFVITDGGMNHHLTATGNMGQVFRKSYPLANLTRMDEPAGDPVAVAGPLCTPLDSFGASVALARPHVGDLLGVFYSGAYGYSASNLGFLSHETPAEVVLLDGQAHELRAQGRAADVLSGQRAISGAVPVPVSVD